MSKWFMPREPLPAAAGVRLFCFPYAGGGAGVFAPLRQFMDGVAAVQYPGRESRIGEPPLADMDSLANAVVREIAPFTAQPYALLGHSLGARVAYEAACRLRDAGLPSPRHLFVAGSRTPRMPELHPIHHLDDKAFLEGMFRFAGTPDELRGHEEVLRFFLPMLRADFTISETWIAPKRPPLDVPITAFCGDADDDAPARDMQGWSAFTSRRFGFRLLEGAHFALFSHMEEAASTILECLGGDVLARPFHAPLAGCAAEAGTARSAG
ncbi:MAG: thioesterase [Desulfovibrio sp.]|jgi:surfactin synthase thioesterase subunit|nr:thioesterase [Desulfovibrio sp.]MBQ2476929.1 thioesterase [Desulfovibrio sp.]